jgi:hypothetical protein
MERLLSISPLPVYVAESGEGLRCNVCNKSRGFDGHSVSLDAINQSRGSGCRICGFIFFVIFATFDIEDNPLDTVYVGLTRSGIISLHFVGERYRGMPEQKSVRLGRNFFVAELFTVPGDFTMFILVYP